MEITVDSITNYINKIMIVILLYFLFMVEDGGMEVHHFIVVLENTFIKWDIMLL